MLSPVEAATRWLARPRNAWGVVAAALILTLLGPIGLAYGREAMLKSRADKLKDLKVGHEGLEKKAAMYEQLERVRWPMTKLMADISAATPVGVVINNMQLNTGQNITLEGTAESPELVTKLQSSLFATRVFSNVTISRQGVKGSGNEFSVSARVTPNAHIPVKLADDQDFAKKPLAVRLYGEGATNTAKPAAVEHTERASRRPRNGGGEARPDRSESKGESGASETTTRRPGGGGATPSGAVPPPLTDADIAKMDQTTAMKEWSSRKAYVPKNPGLDAATKQRLLEESEKCKQQMEKMKSAGGSTPTPSSAPSTAAAPAGGPK
jgi:Tfp pilus assembly protein PilN